MTTPAGHPGGPPADGEDRPARFLVIGRAAPTEPGLDDEHGPPPPPPAEIARVQEQLADAIARLLGIVDEVGEMADRAATDLSRRLQSRRGRVESRLVDQVRKAAGALQDAAGAAMAGLREVEATVLLPAREADEILSAANRAGQAIRDDAAKHAEELRAAAAADRRAAAELLEWVDREFERLAAASDAFDNPGWPRRERPRRPPRDAADGGAPG